MTDFLENIALPADIVPLESLPQGIPLSGTPVVWAPRSAKGDPVRLDIPPGKCLTLVEILPERAETHFSIAVGADAHLNHIRIIAQGADTRYTAQVGDGATLELSTLILGGESDNRYEIDCYQGSSVALYGLGVPTDKERIANRIRLCHKAPLGQSNQVFRYVVDQQAQAVFDGKIIVEKDAQKIQAYQKNDNILLSPTARVESDPQLEIYADDVRCSHGASVGQLDQTALFYMRSRGIPYAIARKMLIRSFLDQTLAAVRQDWLGEGIGERLSARMV